MSGSTTQTGPTQQGPQQYLRYISLVVADSSGQGLDLANLRIVFRVNQSSIQTPNSLIARVYNPAPSTIHLIQKEFTQVQLSAGYQQQYGIIFRGLLKQRETGREDASHYNQTWQRAGVETPVDTYIDIYAADGDQAYNYGVVNRTLAAGYSQSDHYNALASSLSSYGISPGALANDLASQQSPRGRVLWGMTRDRLRDFVTTNKMTYTVRDNREIAIQRIVDYDKDEAIVVNSASGMIGIPIQTQEGIVIRVLLNPQIKYGKQIKIKNKDIVQAAPNLQRTAINYVPGQEQFANSGVNTDADGLYKVVAVNHLGDSRGEPWYSECVCTTIDGTQPLSGPSLTSIPTP